MRYLLGLLLLITTAYAITEQTQRLANIQYIGCGVDMSGAQPIEYYIKQPVIDLTYNSTVYMNGIKYLVPSQIQVISTPHTDTQTTVKVYYNSSEVEESIYQSSTFGIKSPFKFIPGMYKNSNDQLYFYEQTTKYGNYSANSYLRVLTFRGTLLAEQVELTHQFVNLINSLPPVYNEKTKSIYQKVIALYGTHIILSAQFGGVVTSQTSANMNYVNTITEEQYISNLNEQFLFMSSTSVLNNTQLQQLAQLNIYYNTQLKLVGGNPGLFPINEWPEWAMTVIENSQILQYNLMPIWKLLESNHFANNPYRKEILVSLRDAVYDYLMPTQFSPIYKLPYPNTNMIWMCDNKDDIEFYCLGMDYSTTILVYGFSYNTHSNTLQNIPVPSLKVNLDPSLIATKDYLYLVGVDFWILNYMDILSREWHSFNSTYFANLPIFTFEYNNELWLLPNGQSVIATCYGSECIGHPQSVDITNQFQTKILYPSIGVVINDLVYLPGEGWGHPPVDTPQFVVINITTIMNGTKFTCVNSSTPNCIYALPSLVLANGKIYSFDASLNCNQGMNITSLTNAVIYDPIKNRFSNSLTYQVYPPFHQSVVYLDSLFYAVGNNYAGYIETLPVHY